MDKISEKIGIDGVSMIKVLDFLPYPFLLSEFRNGAQHNIFVNKRFIEEIGYTCDDIPTIEDWFLRAYPDEAYRNEVIEDWRLRTNHAQGTDSHLVVRQAKIKTRSFGSRWYEVKASVHGPIQFVAFTNIDEEIKNEESLKLLNENKDRTLSILSHDLRSPLAALYSVLQLANSGELNENEKSEALKTLEVQVFQLMELVDTTLLWTKANFHQMIASPRRTDVNAIVNSILKVYRLPVAQKSLNIHVDLDDIQPTCDPEILSILFRNIFSNAIKFTPASGSVFVRFSGRNHQPVLSVENSGTAIAQSKIDEILGKEYSSQPGTKGEKGLGLGLNLCMHLLEDIGGKLEIESIPPDRTIFKIILPV